jgi:hypothetical protein
MRKRKTACSGPVWRIMPMPSIRYSVEAAAGREGLSVADMLIRLVGEALKARVAADPVHDAPLRFIDHGQ